MTNKTEREPLFRISKRGDITKEKTVMIKAIALVAGLLLGAIICSIIAKRNPIDYFIYLFKGAFGSKRLLLTLAKDLALLLIVALALLPAFKMKFWNLGGNGQILMGCLATILCMQKLGGKLPDAVVIIFMIISSVLAGAVWAIIPAIFKAFFKTNESLFTLMLNYVASGLVGYYITKNANSGSNTIKPIDDVANLPVLGHDYVLTILVAVLVLAFMFVFFRYSKRGYEITVVGESESTAKYVGIDVKAVIIRTMALSGAICGLVGLLLVGSLNHTITTSMASNRGFTGIMVAWLGKLDPLIMFAAAFFIVFVDRGMSMVKTEFGLTNNALSNLVLGLIYFFIIGCEFFITYTVKFRARKSKKEQTALETIEMLEAPETTETSEIQESPETTETSQAPETQEGEE